MCVTRSGRVVCKERVSPEGEGSSANRSIAAWKQTPIPLFYVFLAKTTTPTTAIRVSNFLSKCVVLYPNFKKGSGYAITHMYTEGNTGAAPTGSNTHKHRASATHQIGLRFAPNPDMSVAPCFFFEHHKKTPLGHHQPTYLPTYPTKNDENRRKQDDITRAMSKAIRQKLAPTGLALLISSPWALCVGTPCSSNFEYSGVPSSPFQVPAHVKPRIKKKEQRKRGHRHDRRRLPTSLRAGIHGSFNDNPENSFPCHQLVMETPQRMEENLSPGRTKRNKIITNYFLLFIIIQLPAKKIKNGYGHPRVAGGW